MFVVGQGEQQDPSTFGLKDPVGSAGAQALPTHLPPSPLCVCARWSETTNVLSAGRTERLCEGERVAGES